MKRFTFLVSVIMLLAVTLQSQTVVPILMARAQPVGSTVTIKGIMLNVPSQMGWTCYIQDETGGIAGYPTSGFGGPAATQGDIITVTGVLKNYNSLLEISPYTELVIESSNNPLPDPTVLSIPQITTGTGGEDHESMLVKLNNVHFKPEIQGTLFNGGTSGTNYDVYDLSGNTMQVRILPNTTANNTLIPMGNVNIVGCLGQYSPSNPASGYQVIPRSVEDITINSSISLTTPTWVSDITTSSVTVNWTTDNPGSSFLKYGTTTNLELGVLTGTGNTTDHSVTIPGSAAQLFYARAYSVSGTVSTDTAKSTVGAYITASNSSGLIRTYFNAGVDHSVSTGTNAISIGQAVDDTLIGYINRAKQSIDIAIYSFDNDGLSNMSAALNSAASRGVNIRVVYCGTTVNAAVSDLSGSIHTLQGPGENNSSNPARDGIMHNKFMVIDANSANAADPIVWTGSFNWTKDNMNTDPNNVIIIQDQSLARTYVAEFEEMWGSKTLTPNAANAKFGSAKVNNTPHQLKVGGKWMECYFSPSDNVNVEIINRIESAESDLEAAVMLITRKEMAYAVSDAVLAGASASFLVTSYSDLITGTTPDSTVFKTLRNVCAEFGDFNGGGIMHNKYLIVDQSNTASDPVVWTGSHNWSASANNFNDENSIVIHDATLANVYYQNFVELMKTADILYGIDDPKGFTGNDFNVYPNPANSFVNVDVKSAGSIAYKVQLLDLSGRLILESLENATAGINHSGFDTSRLSPGIYLVRVVNKNGSATRKLMIQ
ncbi:MAG: T9SS type A sorting domain-containing protein [Bacteroidales bacterium]|nr:T9SS type A sorting domain-containing protein [Bacteroidales bacterium]